MQFVHPSRSLSLSSLVPIIYKLVILRQDMSSSSLTIQLNLTHHSTQDGFVSNATIVAPREEYKKTYTHAATGLGCQACYKLLST